MKKLACGGGRKHGGQVIKPMVAEFLEWSFLLNMLLLY